MSARNVARFALLTAVALVLGYVERLIPLTAAAPGVKLGLANTVLLYAVYQMDAKSAWALLGAKVLLTGLLFSGLSGLAYSAGGGALSLVVMLSLRRARGVSVVGVSVAGAVAHNIGQIAVACLIVQSRGLLAYLPVLLAAGAATGFLTGVVARCVLRNLRMGERER